MWFKFYFIFGGKRGAKIGHRLIVKIHVLKLRLEHFLQCIGIDSESVIEHYKIFLAILDWSYFRMPSANFSVAIASWLCSQRKLASSKETFWMSMVFAKDWLKIMIFCSYSHDLVWHCHLPWATSNFFSSVSVAELSSSRSLGLLSAILGSVRVH